MQQLSDTNILPAPTETGLKKFLESPYIKGIGPVYAQKILDKTGLSLIYPDAHWDTLLKNSGILSEDKIEDIKESLKNLKVSPSLISLLYSSGLSDVDVEKIIGHYGKRTEKILVWDPYDMVENVWKLSFFTADKIGNFLSIDKSDPRRLRGAILTSIKLFAEEGNLFATESQTLSKASKISGVNEDLIRPQIDKLIEEGRVIRSYDGLYLPVYYNAEKEAAEKLLSMIRNASGDKLTGEIPNKDINGNLLSEKQKEAISTVMKNKVSIITGGPGTGKTTAIRGVIDLFLGVGKKVILAAPTGRAAKRISELTGEEAMTIHRLLGYSMGRGYKNKKLKADILVLDEASMLEQVLFNHLLQAVGDDTRIVLVGDPDQLPAIGAGNVLKDMMDSEVVPMIRLDENFRQMEGSDIAANASAIREGEFISKEPSAEFVYVKEDSAKTTRERIFSLIDHELPAYTGIESNRILLVTPQQEGSLGAKQLNIELQERLNPDSPELKRGMKRFRLGDRVMQTSNSSLRGVYNGEIGIVTRLDPEAAFMEVTFSDGKKSLYNIKEIKELSLAYATTIHKLQGSEADYIVLVMSSAHKPMLYRNLLYTGVSRAKKLCVVVGDENAVSTAITTADKHVRNSNLGRRLAEEKEIPI